MLFSYMYIVFHKHAWFLFSWSTFHSYFGFGCFLNENFWELLWQWFSASSFSLLVLLYWQQEGHLSCNTFHAIKHTNHYWPKRKWKAVKTDITLHALSQYHSCGSMMIPRRIRLWWKWSKLRYAFDLTTIQLRYDYDKKVTCSFFARIESHRMEAGACDMS